MKPVLTAGLFGLFVGAVTRLIASLMLDEFGGETSNIATALSLGLALGAGYLSGASVRKRQTRRAWELAAWRS